MNTGGAVLNSRKFAMSSSTTALNYAILSPQFLNLSKDTVLELKISTSSKDVDVVSIQLQFPEGVLQLMDGQGLLMNRCDVSSGASVFNYEFTSTSLVSAAAASSAASSGSHLSVAALDEQANAQNVMGSDQVEYCCENNVITLRPVRKQTAFIGSQMAWTIKIPVRDVSMTLGECKISINEVVSISRSNEQKRQSFLILKKFPKEFQLSDFSVDKLQICSGELLTFSWKANLYQRYPMMLSLVIPSKQIVIDVTRCGDALGNYHYTMPIEAVSIKAEKINVELRADVLDDKKRPLLTQSFALPETINVQPPSIKYFVAYGDSIWDEEKIKAGSKVILNWQSVGKVDHYILDIDDTQQKQLPGNITTYEDIPTYSTNYRLSAYAKSYSDVVDVKTTSALLYRLPHQPESTFQSDELITTQISSNNLKLYVATETSIQVIDTQTGQVTTTIPMNNGINAMTLSPDDMTLYVANNKTFTITVINTANHTTIAPEIVFPKAPRLLLLNQSGSVLYVATDNKIMALKTVERQILFETEITGRFVSAWALTPNDAQLLVTSGDTNVIAVINAMTGVPEGQPIEIQFDNRPEKIKPRHLIVSKNGQQVFFAMASINGVVVVNLANPGNKSDVILSDICQNTGALLLQETMLYVTNSRNHAVVVYDLTKQTSKEMPVGLNPRQLVMSENGERVFVVCENSLWSFWTKTMPISRPILSTITVPNKVTSKAEQRLLSNKSLPLPEKNAAARAIQDLGAAFKNENQVRAKVLEQGQFGFFFPNVRQKDFVEKSAESLTSFGFFFPGSSAVIKSTTLSVPERTKVILPVANKDENTIVTEAPVIIKSVSNAKAQSSAVLKEQLSAGWFSSSCVLTQQAQPHQFTLTLPQNYRESSANYDTRLKKVLSTLKQVPVLGGIEEPSVTKAKPSDRTSIIMITASRTDQAETVKGQLEKMTGLVCQSTVPKMLSLTKK